MRRAVLLAALLATAACRQIAGLQDLPQPCVDPLMIDDMEDGDSSICNSDGRHGDWFTLGDGTSTDLTPAGQPFVMTSITDGKRGASRRAAHFAGSGFSDWGAVMGMYFNVGVLSRNTYDAGSAGGVTFWMKSKTPVSIQFLTSDTVIEDEGGRCSDGAATNNCGNHFSFQIPAPGDDWKQYEVPFSALRQSGSAFSQSGSATWKSSQLLGVQFLVGAGASFDVWVDDVAFYYGAAAPTCTDPRFPVACAERGGHRAGCFPPDTSCAAITTWCTDPALIDDMEDGDNTTCNGHGFWSSGSDQTSTDLSLAATAIPGGRGTSRLAARLAGSGFADFALMGTSLNSGGVYDASAAGGLAFWTKTSASHVLVLIDTPATIPARRGGTCVDSAVALNCDHGWYLRVAVPQPDTWFEAKVPFAALRQLPGYSDTTGNLLQGALPWTPAELVTVKFAVEDAFAPFELWVDDLALYACSGADCLPSCVGAELPVACPASSGRVAQCWPSGTDCAASMDIIDSRDVWGSGRNDVWAVGSSSLTSAGTVLHWDGTRWLRNDAGVVPPLRAVSGNGASDVWAVGDHGTVLQRSGSAWAATNVGGDASFNDVWAVGPGDVWAIGYPGSLRHWNGSGWSTARSTDTYLAGVWGSGPDDIWAAGDVGTILHWNGADWSPATSPTTTPLSSLWGSGPKDVWAVGAPGTIAHFDGSAWTAVPGGTGWYVDVWGSGPNDVWAVGFDGAMLHWNGTIWSAATSPTKLSLHGVWGSAANDVWAVGYQNTILHFDGDRWTPVAISWGSP